jgi:hypothetical protein
MVLGETVPGWPDGVMSGECHLYVIMSVMSLSATERPKSTHPRRRAIVSLLSAVIVAAATLAACAPDQNTVAVPSPPAWGTPIPVQVATWCNPVVNSCQSAHVLWNTSVSSINQTIQVNAIGPTTYFPIGWNEGYLGVQTNGNSVSGVTGPTAVFSIAGTGVKVAPVNGAPNPNCSGDFDGSSGVSCRVPLPAPIEVGNVYTYRVTRQADGYVRGEVVPATGGPITIALIHPAPGTPTTFNGLYNFIENFGAPVGAGALVPKAAINFGQPIAGTNILFVDRLLGACATASHNGSWGLVLSLGGSGCGF